MHLVLFTCYVAVQYVWLKIFFQIFFSSRFSFDMTSILSPLNSYQAFLHRFLDFLGKSTRITNENFYCKNNDEDNNFK